MSTDPFARDGGLPSIGFGGKTPEGGIFRKAVGTKYRIRLTKLPAKVQARDYDSGKPKFWGNETGTKTTEPNDKPVMTVVTTGTIVSTNDTASNALAVGTEASLWSEIPSSMFAAIGDAIKAAGGNPMAVDGELEVELVGFKQGENKNRAAASQFKATYFPPNAFAAETPVAAAQPAGPPAAPAPPPPAPAPAAAEPTVDGFTKAQWESSGYTAAHFAADPKFSVFVAPAAPPAPPAPPAAPAAPPAPPAVPSAPAKTITRADADLLGMDDATLASRGFQVVG